MDNNLRENIATVPKTLYCVNSVIQAFKLQLKIFYKLPEFFDLMEKHKTVLVRASTGTGKSSMLPALILAMGYKRVVVTQPRRLPCKLIS
jgi:HrpA-like RNA helicase